MTRYFGTDGIRGVANADLDCELAFAFGRTVVEKLGTCFVVGRDTRRSGHMLEAALVAGITSAGGDALIAGIVPTPAVAWLVRTLGASGGIVISASHNAPEYNGLKLFDAEGFKPGAELLEAVEARLTDLLDPQAAQDKPHGAPLTGASLGRAFSIADAAVRYSDYAVSTITGRVSDLEGITVALDCCHGAAAVTTPQAITSLKGRVVSINADFNGDDINVACGSTNLEPLANLVVKSKASLGIAHDGDADRVIAVDETGAVVDGDVIEAIIARDLKERGILAGNTVVTTVMANLGFAQAMEQLGIEVVETDVGDAHVLAAMRTGGFVLGGEQSGHIIYLEHNTTGDGLVVALQLLAIMKESGRSLSELAKVMTARPQKSVSVRRHGDLDAAETARIKDAPELARLTAEAQAELEAHGGGKVLLRPSGTEPLIRVTVWADTEDLANQLAQRLAQEVARLFGEGNHG
ncbi:MAG: phosphoglucosamine mutase [Coriobacteriales bacterium]|jgi:phosphoglucosamine mutase|nr:phosphoglucosamine mutase [Coriobacteriales bacterium]